MRKSSCLDIFMLRSLETPYIAFYFSRGFKFFLHTVIWYQYSNLIEIIFKHIYLTLIWAVTVITTWVRVNLGVMASKMYSTFLEIKILNFNTRCSLVSYPGHHFLGVMDQNSLQRIERILLRKYLKTFQILNNLDCRNIMNSNISSFNQS